MYSHVDGEQKVAFASINFWDALNYAGPIAVRSRSARANVMIVLGVYQDANHCQSSGLNGDSRHALQAMCWHVSDVYVRAWVGTHAEDIGPSGFEKEGRFNWKNTHEYREIIEPWNNLAQRVKADIAKRIEMDDEPMGSKLFRANMLLARQPPRDETDAAATTAASSATRQPSAAHHV